MVFPLTVREAFRGTEMNPGEQEYTPMIYEIYGRSSWGRFRDAIEGAWPAYLNGKRTLSEAAADLIQAIGEPGVAE